MVRPDDSDWQRDLQRMASRLAAKPEDRWQAQVNINCFRQGSPPQHRIRDLTVGLTDVLPAFDRELRRARDGACCLTLVYGPYGAGKSHSLFVLRDRAFDQGFLVSTVTLTQRECPFSDLGVVYSHISRAIQSRDAGGVHSIHDVMESWTRTIHRDGQVSWERAQRRIRQLHPDFQKVLAHYIDGRSVEMTDLAERWLTGVDSSKRTASKLGATLRPTNEDALAMLRELGTLSRSIGFSGIVILLDEAEAIPSYSRSSARTQCYENLCRLISPDLHVPGCYFVYATTPALFDRAVGLPLSQSSRQVVGLSPFTEPQLVRIGTIVRDLYVLGENFQTRHAAVDDSQVLACAHRCFSSSTHDVRPRGFVRSLVSSLDICAQNPRRKLAEVFSWCET